MEWSKIKTIIILILLAVNASLLWLALSRAGAQADAERASRQELIAVFQKNGIELREEQIPKKTEMQRLRFDRDREQEKQIAGILGEVAEQDQGGGIYLYTGGGGSALFRGNGEFDIEAKQGIIPADPARYESYAASLLKRLGMDADTGTAAQTVEGRVSTSAGQTQDGLPVFNCQVTAVFENGSLVSLSGRRMTSSPTKSETVSAVSTETALLHFLSYLNVEGEVCNRILSIRQGYVARTSASDPLSLAPVWEIVTDTGSYYVDGEAGTVEKAG